MNGWTQVRAGEGHSIWLHGFGVDYKIAGGLVGGRFAIVEHPIDPGVLAPPHTHSREDELCYVLEGRVGLKVGEDVIDAGPGDYVFRPRGIPHAFWNATTEPARILEIITPAGFEQYFLEVAVLAQRQVDPFDPQRAELRERYGLTGNPEWVPDLEARFGVKL
jgi:quercetin dioxygenase-like cupin family protein